MYYANNAPPNYVWLTDKILHPLGCPKLKIMGLKHVWGPSFVGGAVVFPSYESPTKC